MKEPTVVAEIGCNHMGSMEIARQLIQTAAEFANCDYVKFQKRNPRELLTPAQYDAPHPNPKFSFGDTYGAHREFLELNLDQHRQLLDWCHEYNIGYSSSVWDLTSAKEIASLNPKNIKIPSACNLHMGMLGFLCAEYGGELHVSLGMTTPSEEDRIVAYFEAQGRLSDVVLYACTSGYPVPIDQVCLLELPRLRETYDGQIKGVGFSGHHLGISIDSAAAALGAEWIERHFTLDRTWKGTDHAASLEPDGLRRLVRDVRNVALAMRSKEVNILPIEEDQRAKLKWRQSP